MQYSIVIPTYNRPFHLKACLASIAEMDTAGISFEVLIADDGSDYCVKSLAESVDCAFPVSVARGQHGGVSAARNLGAEHARGTFLIFLDDDCRPSRNWLRKIDTWTDRFPDSLIGGRLRNGLKDNICSVTAQLILDMVYRRSNRGRRSARFLAGANWVMKRSAYLELGGCDTEFPPYGAEDREFCDRWLASGRAMHFAEDASVEHHHTLNIRSFANMYYCYGRGAYVYHMQRRQNGLSGMFDKFLFYAHVPTLLSPVSRVKGLSRKAKVCLLMGLWQLANIYGYLREAARWRYGNPRSSSG
ncbi:glycosyltransferase family 2 protein [Elongatibacter sediminis]|uniref:Glycosyltransferase n=1 Tax=Elongatibacter sediminis TaxID=3119006 RepID=A0AAW9RFK1_9GAMM